MKSPIEQIEEDGVIAGGQHIRAATVIWCAGVKARPVAQWLGLRPAKSGQIEVGAYLSPIEDDAVFIIGDAALCRGQNGKPLPGLAAVAKQQGEYVGKLIGSRLRNESPLRSFQYVDKGTLATIGRHSAIADDENSIVFYRVEIGAYFDLSQLGRARPLRRSRGFDAGTPGSRWQLGCAGPR